MAIRFLGLEKTDVGTPFPQKLHPRLYELLVDCHKTSQVFCDSIEMALGSKKLYLNVVTSPRENKRGAILVLQDKSIQSKVLQMRQNFIANASHELKTPIAIIYGFGELLQENQDLPKKTVQEIIDKIVRNCNRMTKIIKNLLTLADIENLPLSRITQCDVSELIKSCTNTLQTLYPEARVLLIYNENDALQIACDSDLIEVALSNLLDNAAKYSKAIPEISIVIEKIPSYVKIQVRDQGIGIPQHDLEHIFQRFYTVNKIESKKKGGSGLGLSIVETIVEKHFGKVYAESELGVGTTFTMLIADNIEQRQAGYVS
jgi:two-component system phosphate regulon sensor histidine kinase PhoR